MMIYIMTKKDKLTVSNSKKFERNKTVCILLYRQ